LERPLDLHAGLGQTARNRSFRAAGASSTIRLWRFSQRPDAVVFEQAAMGRDHHAVAIRSMSCKRCDEIHDR